MNILELAQEAGLVKRLNATDDYLDKLKAFADLVRDEKIAHLEDKLAIATHALVEIGSVNWRSTMTKGIVNEALKQIRGEV